MDLVTSVSEGKGVQPNSESAPMIPSEHMHSSRQVKWYSFVSKNKKFVLFDKKKQLMQYTMSWRLEDENANAKTQRQCEQSRRPATITGPRTLFCVIRSDQSEFDGSEFVQCLKWINFEFSYFANN